MKKVRLNNLQNETTEKFKHYLQQMGYSKSSVNMLPACVVDFFHYTGEREVHQIRQEQIEAFYEYLQNRKHKRKAELLSETFIHHNMYSLKVFFSWLELAGQIKENPISNLKFKRPKVNTREPLSKQEISKLFEAAKNAKQTAILHLFYSCGLRRTEGETLNTSDIHFSQHLLYVREGKGAKRRVIPVSEKVKQELESYFSSERRKTGSEAFMLGSTGKRMRGESFSRALKEMLKRAGIDKAITLHHLRHSIATHLLENGLKVEFVKEFLGHSHLETTQLYAKVKGGLLKHL